MRGTVLHGPRDIRFEDRPQPKITKPTDAIISLSATCICGSDLWSYRGIESVDEPTPMGHEYCGIVEEVGKEVRNIKPGQFVVGSFATSDNTCAICRDAQQCGISRSYEWTSNEQDRNLPPKGPLTGLPEPFASIRCFRRLIPHWCKARV